METNGIAARLERALQRRLAQPPEQRRADLIRRGVIDDQGKVLLQAPSGPIESETSAKDGDTKQ